MNDLDSLVKHANNPGISGRLTNKFPYPYTAENAKNFIEFATSKTPRNIMAIDINGEAVGGIGIHPQDDIQCMNAEMGYWLAEPYWGQGIMTDAIRQMVIYGFNNFGINRIFARPFGNNVASQKVLEKAGFMLEGRFEKTFFKNGEYLDELIYAVRKKQSS
jgi:RimJ/RimL family protein N-acetyltransferase